MPKEIARRETKELENGVRPGASLASLKINMPEFCQKFNEKTRGQKGKVKAKILVYKDGTYQFFIKGKPINDLIKETFGDRKEITEKELTKISQVEFPQLNTNDPEKVKKIIKGVLKSHHIKVVD